MSKDNGSEKFIPVDLHPIIERTDGLDATRPTGEHVSHERLLTRRNLFLALSVIATLGIGIYFAKDSLNPNGEESPTCDVKKISETKLKANCPGFFDKDERELRILDSQSPNESIQAALLGSKDDLKQVCYIPPFKGGQIGETLFKGPVRCLEEEKVLVLLRQSVSDSLKHFFF